RPNHIAVVGDSAGGGLAITTMLRAREKGLPLPAAAMPLSPWVDMEGKGATFQTNAEKDVLVSQPMVQMMAGMFLGPNGDPRNKLANPTQADLAGLPPLFIQVGGDEALLDDSRALAAAARRAGVDVTIEVEPEMQHVYHVLAGTAPEADAAIGRLATWVRPKLELG
ncbi:MAG: alpha/beta hydrolase fold domain-containing protein, partial [Acetobacteraceae bacterium]|nr:alpha/beta hydrolase fold domain-containing protein [Acetobacteraceae bacterium]